MKGSGWTLLYIRGGWWTDRPNNRLYRYSLIAKDGSGIIGALEAPERLGPLVMRIALSEGPATRKKMVERINRIAESISGDYEREALVVLDREDK